ncbi:MAG: terminase family protein [Thermodesulfobacteriota bacterium]|nr:terminase family protein [Thermodesulfobacteriota bacterium]
MRINVPVNKPQDEFHRMPHKYRGFIGGYGSSKTWAGCQAMCASFWQWPGVNQGYFAPTYPMIRDIFYLTIEEVAESMGLQIEIKESNKEVHFYRGRQYRGTTICRSMERPETIIGFKIGHAIIDEIDILPIKKAETTWRKIIARMRYNVPGLKNGIDIMSTPEGFRFCHKLFIQNIQEKPELSTNYGFIQASTYDNEKYLPANYISSLKEIYPAELINAYIAGQFVNLTSGTVFRSYDRIRCNSPEMIQEKEPLFIGQDFNVQKMASAIFVQRSDGFHAVAELKDIFDTPDVVKVIKERWADKGHRIIMYPDASAGSRKTVDASKSDLALLAQAGYAIRAHTINPPIRDRILATNKAFEVGKVKVNAQACSTIARCLEQQSYTDDGEPDKTAGFDHMNEAFSYFVAYEYPIIRPMSRMKITGI